MIAYLLQSIIASLEATVLWLKLYRCAIDVMGYVSLKSICILLCVVYQLICGQKSSVR